MIVDSSALLSIVLGESDAEALLALMIDAPELGVSAASVVEAMIVAEARQGESAGDDLQALLADLECEIIPLDEEQSTLATAAWRRFGKGRHPAGLNLGDCFSYACAASTGRPLLAKGNDFPQTSLPLVTP